MRMDGILFSYEIMPRDRGDIALEEVSKLIDSLSEMIPELKDAEIIFKPEGVKGLILVDLRKALEKATPERVDNIYEAIIHEIKRAFDEGELLSISRVRIIHKIVRTDINIIADESKYFVPFIKDKWKIEIHTKKIIDRMETIKKVATHFDKPVDLKNPRYVLHIEVIGSSLTVMYLVDTQKVEKTIIKL